MIVLIDNYDSFSYNVFQLIGSVEPDIKMVRNDEYTVEEIEKMKPEALILSPGPGKPSDAGICIETIRYFAGKIPILGICLGLQLMFESSEETPGVEGLHLLDGTIHRIPAAPGLKIPHIGWNDLTFPNKGRLFRGIEEHSYVYFVHSFYLEAADSSIVTATTEYGTRIHASVEKDNIFACQFHPEKSSRIGLKILQNFVDVTKEYRDQHTQGGQ